jgi:glutathione S-transferase
MGEREGEKVRMGMRYFDNLLGSQPCLAGEDFSMADITLFAGLMHADVSGITVPADHTALRGWRDRVSELPCVRDRSGQAFMPEDLRRLGF